MNKNIVNTKFLVSTALIAAIYVVMTLAIAPLSFGMIQIRISEVLMLMAFIDKKYAPGLVLGCFIAKMCIRDSSCTGSRGPFQKMMQEGRYTEIRQCRAEEYGRQLAVLDCLQIEGVACAVQKLHLATQDIPVSYTHLIPKHR